jgi:predicted transcriptional regulator
MTKTYITTREAMNSAVHYIDGMASAEEAIRMMRANKVKALIVKRRYEGDAYGIVVLNDIIRGVIIPDKRFTEVSVYEIMTKPVISVPHDMNIRYAARMLFNIGIKHAPVEEKGEYIGMISMMDMMMANLESQ